MAQVELQRTIGRCLRDKAGDTEEAPIRYASNWCLHYRVVTCMVGSQAGEAQALRHLHWECRRCERLTAEGNARLRSAEELAVRR